MDKIIPLRLVDICHFPWSNLWTWRYNYLMYRHFLCDQISWAGLLQIPHVWHILIRIRQNFSLFLSQRMLPSMPQTHDLQVLNFCRRHLPVRKGEMSRETLALRNHKIYIYMSIINHLIIIYIIYLPSPEVAHKIQTISNNNYRHRSSSPKAQRSKLSAPPPPAREKKKTPKKHKKQTYQNLTSTIELLSCFCASYLPMLPVVDGRLTGAAPWILPPPAGPNGAAVPGRRVSVKSPQAPVVIEWAKDAAARRCSMKWRFKDWLERCVSLDIEM